MKKGSLSSKKGYAPCLELLEDRTLLSGNVNAVLVGNALTITGDIGNNAIHLTEYTNAGITYLRVQGDLVITPPTPPDLTTVNGVSYADFVQESISSITMNMNTGIAGANAGADKITIGTAGSFIPPGTTLTGFQIPGNLTINLGTGQGLAPPAGTQSVTIMGAATPLAPVWATTAVTANIISITGGNTTAGNGNELITLTNVDAGSVRVTTGTGNDNVSMTGANIGTVVINTGTAGNETVSLTNSPGDSTPPLPRPAFGQVSITTAGGNDNITFGGAGANAVTSGNVSINAGDGNNNITVGGATGANNMKVVTIVAGNGTNNIAVRGTILVSASITNGTGNNSSIDFSNNTVSGAAGLTILSNTPLGGALANNTVTIRSDLFTGGGPVTATIGDGNLFFTNPATANLPAVPTATFSSFAMTGDTGIGAATINLGKNFKNVTVGSDLTTNVVSATSLTLNVGTGSDIVAVNTTISGNEAITVLDMVVLPGANATSFPTPPTVSVAGTAGSMSGAGLTVGNNAKTVTQAAVVTGTENVTIGNALTIALNLPTAVSILRPTAGASNISIGNNWGSITVTGTDSLPSPNQAVASEIMTVGTSDGVISVTGLLSGNESLTVGDNWTSLSVSVSVGISQTINAGNGNGSVSVTSPVTLDQTISVGNGTGTVTISGGTRNEVYTFGTGPRTVNLSGAISGSQTVNLGANITLNDTVTAPGGMVIQATVAGDAAGSVITVGPATAPALAVASLAITVGTGSTVTVQNVADAGALSITTGTSSAVTIQTVTTGGILTVNMGDLATQLFIFNSNFATDANITMGLGIDGVSGTFVWFQGDVFGNDLNFNAGANGGNYTAYLLNLNILDAFNMNLGGTTGGVNSVFAMGVECLFGNIDGGTGGSDIYYDLGGNLGYTTTSFEGYY